MTTIPANLLLLGWFLLGFLLYVLLLRRLADVVQPHRLQLAELGEGLLVERLTPEDEAGVRFCLNTAFAAWPLFIGFFLLPAFLVSAPWRRRPKRPSESIESKMGKLLRCYLVSVAAANPVFAILCVVEIALAMGIAIVLAGHVAMVRDATRALLSMEARIWPKLSTKSWA